MTPIHRDFQHILGIMFPLCIFVPPEVLSSFVVLGDLCSQHFTFFIIKTEIPAMEEGQNFSPSLMHLLKCT